MFLDLGLPNTSVSPAQFASAVAKVQHLVKAVQPFPWPLQMRGSSISGDSTKAAEILDTLGKLQTNWDGYGASEVSEPTCINAKNVVEQLLMTLPLPDISPNSNDTVSLEWDAERGIAHLEIGVTRFSFFVRPKTGEPVYSSGPIDELFPQVYAQMVARQLFELNFSNLSITDFRFAVNDV